MGSSNTNNGQESNEEDYSDKSRKRIQELKKALIQRPSLRFRKDRPRSVSAANTGNDVIYSNIAKYIENRKKRPIRGQPGYNKRPVGYRRAQTPDFDAFARQHERGQSPGMDQSYPPAAMLAQRPITPDWPYDPRSPRYSGNQQDPDHTHSGIAQGEFNHYSGAAHPDLSRLSDHRLMKSLRVSLGTNHFDEDSDGSLTHSSSNLDITPSEEAYPQPRTHSKDFNTQNGPLSFPGRGYKEGSVSPTRLTHRDTGTVNRVSHQRSVSDLSPMYMPSQSPYHGKVSDIYSSQITAEKGNKLVEPPYGNSHTVSMGNYERPHSRGTTGSADAEVEKYTRNPSGSSWEENGKNPERDLSFDSGTGSASSASHQFYPNKSYPLISKYGSPRSGIKRPPTLGGNQRPMSVAEGRSSPMKEGRNERVTVSKETGTASPKKDRKSERAGHMKDFRNDRTSPSRASSRASSGRNSPYKDRRNDRSSPGPASGSVLSNYMYRGSPSLSDVSSTRGSAVGESHMSHGAPGQVQDSDTKYPWNSPVWSKLEGFVSSQEMVNNSTPESREVYDNPVFHETDSDRSTPQPDYNEFSHGVMYNDGHSPQARDNRATHRTRGYVDGSEIHNHYGSTSSDLDLGLNRSGSRSGQSERPISRSSERSLPVFDKYPGIYDTPLAQPISRSNMKFLSRSHGSEVPKSRGSTPVNQGSSTLPRRHGQTHNSRSGSPLYQAGLYYPKLLADVMVRSGQRPHSVALVERPQSRQSDVSSRSSPFLWDNPLSREVRQERLSSHGSTSNIRESPTMKFGNPIYVHAQANRPTSTDIIVVQNSENWYDSDCSSQEDSPSRLNAEKSLLTATVPNKPDPEDTPRPDRKADLRHSIEQLVEASSLASSISSSVISLNQPKSGCKNSPESRSQSNLKHVTSRNSPVIGRSVTSDVTRNVHSTSPGVEEHISSHKEGNPFPGPGSGEVNPYGPVDPDLSSSESDYPNPELVTHIARLFQDQNQTPKEITSSNNKKKKSYSEMFEEKCVEFNKELSQSLEALDEPGDHGINAADIPEDYVQNAEGLNIVDNTDENHNYNMVMVGK